MEQTSGKDVKAILLAGLSTLAMLVMLAGGVFSLVTGIMEWRVSHNADTSLLPAFLSLAAFALAGALIGRSGLLALRRIQNKPIDEARLKPLSLWLGLALFVGWILSIVLAVFIYQKPILQWFSIPFYLLSIGLPVYALARTAAGGLELGSKLRAWGTLSAGMTLAPFLSLLAEGLVAIILLIIIGIFMGLNPQRLEAIQALVGQLKNISSQEQALSLLAPILSNPLTLVGGLFFLSLATPLIEESAKSLGVWLAWRKLASPAQGFALGALSGAGFGLMEGLFISTSAGETWGTTLAVRAASSSMHIIASSLVGWGIGKAAQQKRVTPALGGYALGMTIHGVWNACIVVMVFASGRLLLTPSNPDIIAALVILLALGFLALLILSLPIVLLAINHQLRKSVPVPSEPVPPATEFVETLSDENMVR